MAESAELLADKLRRLATEDNFLNAYARRRMGARYDRELIAFEVGGERYALAITELREIVKMRPITEVPRVPPFVKGVVSVRGRVLAAIDLRVRLGMPAAEPDADTRVLVCEVDGEAYGLIVDRVHSVVRLRDDQIEGPPPMGAGVDARFLAGIGRRDGELIILLDLPAVVTFSLGEDR